MHTRNNLTTILLLFYSTIVIPPIFFTCCYLSLHFKTYVHHNVSGYITCTLLPLQPWPFGAVLARVRLISIGAGPREIRLHVRRRPFKLCQADTGPRVVVVVLQVVVLPCLTDQSRVQRSRSRRASSSVVLQVVVLRVVLQSSPDQSREMRPRSRSGFCRRPPMR